MAEADFPLVTRLRPLRGTTAEASGRSLRIPSRPRPSLKGGYVVLSDKASKLARCRIGGVISWNNLWQPRTAHTFLLDRNLPRAFCTGWCLDALVPGKLCSHWLVSTDLEL
jgi:hypothetical protein